MENRINNKKIKIILVETDEQLGYLLSNFLSKRNFITYICKNPLSLTHSINQHMPDILIIDGFQHIEKYNLNIIYIPVILLTTRGLKNDRITGYKIGFDAYILKPFDPDELIAIIFNLIHKKRNLKELRFLIYRLKTLNVKIKYPESLLNYSKLTPKEKEVFMFINYGLNNKQISHKMAITQRSVEKYVTRIFEKLKIKNRIQLLSYHK